VGSMPVLLLYPVGSMPVLLLYTGGVPLPLLTHGRCPSPAVNPR